MSERIQCSWKVTLTWKDGKVDEGIGWGTTKAEAVADFCNTCGYGQGALAALDYWSAEKEGKLMRFCEKCGKSLDGVDPVEIEAWFTAPDEKAYAHRKCLNLPELDWCEQEARRAVYHRPYNVELYGAVLDLTRRAYAMGVAVATKSKVK